MHRSGCSRQGGARKKGRLRKRNGEDGGRVPALRRKRLPVRPHQKCELRNRDSKALNCLMVSGRMHKVKVGSKDVESIVTNSSELARKMESSKCSTVEEIEKLSYKEITKAVKESIVYNGRAKIEDAYDSVYNYKTNHSIVVNFITNLKPELLTQQRGHIES